jgi:hypothetical protein
MSSQSLYDLEQQLNSLQQQQNNYSPTLSGTQADRPLATTVNSGTLYFPTDGYYIARNDGSIWMPQTQMGASINVVNPPAPNTLTAVNQANSTLVADGDGALVTVMGSVSTADRYENYLTALPGGNYTFKVGFEFLFFWPINWVALGICLTAGTTTADEVVSLILYGGTSAVSLVEVLKTTNYTSSATYYTHSHPIGVPCRLFFQFRDNGTTRYAEMSVDGRNWNLIHSVGRTDFITPTHYGLFTRQLTTSIAANITRAQAKIFHWSLTAGA